MGSKGWRGVSRPARNLRRSLVATLAVGLLAFGESLLPLSSAPPAIAATAGSGNCAQEVSNATGVAVSSYESGGKTYCVITFANPASTTDWTVPAGITEADVLIVAGGGGGGSREWGGGGGAGGVLYGERVSLSSFSSNGAIAVTVGDGGAGGQDASDETSRGSNGGSSSFGSATAPGGGGGGGKGWDIAYSGQGNSGGSGGGSGEHGNNSLRNGELIYSVTNPSRDGNGAITYAVNNSGSFSASITRVVYRMEVEVNGTLRFAEVAFDPWANNLTAANLRVPDATAGDDFVIQRFVENMRVDSNVTAVNDFQSSGVITSQAPTDRRGYLEIWPHNYARDRSTAVTSIGSDGVFDVNDSPDLAVLGHGSFQVHDVTTTGQERTVLAWNNHRSTGVEVGLGNWTGAEPDWTFSGESGLGTTGWKLDIRVNKNQFLSLPGGASTISAPAGFVGYGNAGGSVDSVGSRAGSGGGGAGAAGGVSPFTSYQFINGDLQSQVAGNGGAGRAFDITGTSVTYAGGGGGGAGQLAADTCGLGGAGGGGNGGCGKTGIVVAAGAGTDGLGGGGGGARSGVGGAGGSGVVIVRYDATLPTVEATGVNAITTTEATVSSSTTSSSSAVSARGFVIGPSPDPVLSGAGVTTVAAGSGTGAFSSSLSGLSLGTTYYVRAFATNGGGTAYGPTQVFTTAPNTISTTAGSIRWFEGPTVIDQGLVVTGADISGATVSIDNNKTGDVLACPNSVDPAITCAYNAASGVLTLSGTASASTYQTVMRGITFSTSNTNTVTDARTVTFNLGGSLTFDPSTGHYYEIVTVSSGGQTYSGGDPDGTTGDLASGANISWEESRCRANYTNAEFGGTVEDGNMSGSTRLAGRTTQANDGCVAIGGGSLQPRTLNGLPGHLANITTLSEHQFLRTKLTGTGWIGGSDIDQEGTWIWMDGPEAGQVFWIQNTTTVRRDANSISGVDRFNYWSDGEPNNASGEHWAEFGFGSAGVGSSWNDCRNGCRRTTYIVEYSAPSGVVPPSLSATRQVSPLPAQTISFTPASSLVYGADPLTLSATASSGGQVTFSVHSGAGTICSLSGATLTWIAPGDCVVRATQDGLDADGGVQPAVTLDRTIEMARKPVTVTGLSAISREYDRGTSVALTGTPVLDASGILPADIGNVDVGALGNGSVADANVGTDKPVTVTSGVTLTGSRAFAYEPVVNGVTVTITARPVRLAGSFVVNNRPYDGTTSVTPSATALGIRPGDVVTGDTVTLGAVSYAADSASAGARIASPQTSLTGTDAANYVLDTTGQPTASFTIEPVALSVASGSFVAQSRTANGTLTATITSHNLVLQGFVAGDTADDITWTPRGVFDSAAAGVDRVVTLEGGAVFGGIKGGNYVLDVTTAPTSVATLFPAPITTPPRQQPATTTPTVTEPTNEAPAPRFLPPGRTPVPANPPAPLAGPLPSLNGTNGGAPQAPTAIIGGRPVTVNTDVVGQNQVNLQTDTTSFGLSLPDGQGSIASQGGRTELVIPHGGFTTLSGSGLFPGSTVQVFLPFGNNDSRELGQLRVDESGSFSGQANFTTRPTDPPLPIGRHVLQIASLNAAGERVIVEMAVNIAQPAPAPEFLRDSGETPDLTPGQSLATRAGIPTDVVLTVDSDNSRTLIEGDVWTFSVDVSGGGNRVEETSDGGALISVIRGGQATISGDGFMPLSRADVWLFSDPTLLGSVVIDESGTFTGRVVVDGLVVPLGEHTLQIQGVGVDGYVLAANLGVVVTNADAGAVFTTEQVLAGVLWWAVGLLALLALAAFVGWMMRRRRQTLA